MRNTRVIAFGDIPNFINFETRVDDFAATGFDGWVLAPTLNNLITDIYSDAFYGSMWGNTLLDIPSAPRMWEGSVVPPAANPAHNYLRANATPGNIDWFDPDMSIIQTNFANYAKFARESFCRGIFFDNEPYQGALWHYPSQPQVGLHTYNEYVTQVRAVATAMGLAMWAEFPACQFFVSFNYWVYAADNPKDTIQYGLWGPFLDGILDSMADYPCVNLIQGNEFSYVCNTDPCFEYAVRNSTTNDDFPGITGNSPEFTTHNRIAMATYATTPNGPTPFNNSVTSGNYFTPTGLTDVLVMASQYTDKYLWVYTGGYGWVLDDPVLGFPIRISTDYDNSILNAIPSFP